MRPSFRFTITAALVLAPSIPAGAQSDAARKITVDLAAAAVTRVKAKYFSSDFTAALAAANSSLKQFPGSRELRAWRVAALARLDRPKEAKAEAQALLEANKNDPWGWFAKTAYSMYTSNDDPPGTIVNASEEAYQRQPGNPSTTWLRAITLVNDGQDTRALGVIDSAAAQGPLSQEMKVLRASALWDAAHGKTIDTLQLKAAYAQYAAARESDPNDATAYSFPASRLIGDGHTAEAIPLAKRGIELAPGSLNAHQTYWSSVNGQKDRSQASRDSEVLADAEALLRVHPNEPTVMNGVAGQYTQRGQLARANELQDRIVTNFPRSATAEWVQVQRYRTLAKDAADTTIKDPSLKPLYAATLWAFLKRPAFVNPRLVGDAYRSLFFLTDSSTNADTLLRIVQGMVKYEEINPHIAYAAGAIRLAERGRDFAEAERIARAGLIEGKKKIDAQRSHYETVGDYATGQDQMAAIMYDAIGDVYLHEGRSADAEKQLAHARDLDPKNNSALYHLGQLNEKLGRAGDAEQMYIKGSLIAHPGPNPNRSSLKTLYLKNHGSLDGYDAYLAGLAETDRGNRRTDVAKSRAATPVALASFQLKALDGSSVALDSLRGKTVVINNWGMWCGPCVAEMPEFQKFAEKYANDMNVRVLTINNDPNTGELSAWMTKHGYTFTALLDDGYLSRIALHTFPTTWFVDPDGKVEFTKVGWSEKLAEEFGWRVEMIRNPGGGR